MTNQLSNHDQCVLDTLFDITQMQSIMQNTSKLVKDELPSDVRDAEEDDTEQVKESKRYEVEGIKLAEQEKYQEAIKYFDLAINEAPFRPSAWNNRAQTYRLMECDDDALKDLEEALRLCGNNYPVTKCRAYCQRGLIKRKLGEDEAARDDFNESAKLGSKFARQQLVEMNPYSQMCNQMLSEVMKKLY